MNYIREINAFYDFLEMHELEHSDVLLWHALMHLNNKCGWRAEFTAARSTLVVKTGLSLKTIERSRVRLATAGLLHWYSRDGNRSAVYRMSSVQDALRSNDDAHRDALTDSQSDALPVVQGHRDAHRDAHDDAQPVVQDSQRGNDDAQHDAQGVAQPVVQGHGDALSDAQGDALPVAITKLNKTKEKDIKTPTTGLSPYKLFESEGFGTVSSVLIQKISDLIDDYGERWVVEAMKTAAVAGKRNMLYVQGILKRYRTSGVDEPWREERREAPQDRTRSGKPSLPVVSDSELGDGGVSDEELAELQALAAKLDGNKPGGVLT